MALGFELARYTELHQDKFLLLLAGVSTLAAGKFGAALAGNTLLFIFFAALFLEFFHDD